MRGVLQHSSTGRTSAVFSCRCSADKSLLHLRSRRVIVAVQVQPYYPRPASQRAQQQALSAASTTVAPLAVQDNADEECPVDCVRQLHTVAEWEAVLEETRNTDQLVVVDFFKRACGACKYIQPGFVKLCNIAASEHKPVVFFKHNVVDEDDEDEEQTELAHQMSIKNVPMFKFYKHGVEVDSFATRDRLKVAAAINRHTQMDVVSTVASVDADE